MNEPSAVTDGYIDVGAVADLPDGGCAAVVGGQVLLIRHGDEVIGFVNRCLHRDTPLHEGHISNGTLACPLHHWRYDLRDGSLLGGSAELPSVAVEIHRGRVLVDPPDESTTSISALLRDHARTWSRDDIPQPRSAAASTIVGTRRPPCDGGSR